MELTDGLLVSKVMHARTRPRRHAFSYGVYYLCFPLSAVALLRNKLLSLEKWNLFSFYAKDHGARDGSPLDPWIRKILNDHRLIEADGEIVLMTMPRILGYVFNPVSFWFCFDRSKSLRAVLSEVSNTFGEHHSYLSYHDDHREIGANDWLRAEKLFHVSPFLPLEGHYLFRFAASDTKVNVKIHYYDAQGLMLTTSVDGNRFALSSTSAFKCFVKYPLLTFKVIALIHSEALRLFLKGAKYHSKPPSPTVEVSR